MIRLLYISRPARALTEADTTQILASARRRNGPADITGLLCIGDAAIVQMLEGPERAVFALYDHLHGDDRHRDLALLHIGLANTRLVPRWAMSTLDPQLLPRYSYESLLAKQDPAVDDAARGLMKELLGALRGTPRAAAATQTTVG